MVKVKEDMTGWIMSEHGVPNSRWTVIKRDEDHIKPNGDREAKWWCQCACGNPELKSVLGRLIRSGGSLSCGCLCREAAATKGKNNKQYNEWLDDIFEDENGKYKIGLAHNTRNPFFIDLDDFDLIKDYCWTESVTCTGLHRPVSWIDGKCVPIFHILGCKDWDHIDRNEMNNRRSNLRPCTRQENIRNKSIQSNNTSGIIGISWREDRNKYRAYITVEKRKQIFLGYFHNKEDAIKARLEAEKKYFGEFAPQRHLFKEYGI